MGRDGTSPLGKADRQQPSIPPHESSQRSKQRAADIVDANVKSFACGQLFDSITHILPGIIDDRLGTYSRERSMLWRRCRRRQ